MYIPPVGPPAVPGLPAVLRVEAVAATRTPVHPASHHQPSAPPLYTFGPCRLAGLGAAPAADLPAPGTGRGRRQRRRQLHSSGGSGGRPAALQLLAQRRQRAGGAAQHRLPPAQVGGFLHTRRWGRAAAHALLPPHDWRPCRPAILKAAGLFKDQKVCEPVRARASQRPACLPAARRLAPLPRASLTARRPAPVFCPMCTAGGGRGRDPDGSAGAARGASHRRPAPPRQHHRARRALRGVRGRGAGGWQPRGVPHAAGGRLRDGWVGLAWGWVSGW